MSSLLKDFFNFDPFADHLRHLDEMVKAAYPKYNLVKGDDGSFVLEIAVAGFTKKDLSIEQKSNTLVIECKSPVEVRNYLHKGISSKPFKLLFPISVDWNLKSASLLDGILRITFGTKVAESQKIEIQTPEVEDKGVLKND